MVPVGEIGLAQTSGSGIRQFSALLERRLDASYVQRLGELGTVQNAYNAGLLVLLLPMKAQWSELEHASGLIGMATKTGQGDEREPTLKVLNVLMRHRDGQPSRESRESQGQSELDQIGCDSRSA